MPRILCPRSRACAGSSDVLNSVHPLRTVVRHLLEIYQADTEFHLMPPLEDSARMERQLTGKHGDNELHSATRAPYLKEVVAIVERCEDGEDRFSTGISSRNSSNLFASPNPPSPLRDLCIAGEASPSSTLLPSPIPPVVAAV